MTDDSKKEKGRIKGFLVFAILLILSLQVLAYFPFFNRLFALGVESMAPDLDRQLAQYCQILSIVESTSSQFPPVKTKSSNDDSPPLSMAPAKVVELVETLANHFEPAVIVVDLDTSDTQYRSIRLSEKALDKSVWARTPDALALGGQPLPQENVGMALAESGGSDDLTLRYYPRHVTLVEGTESRTFSTLPVAAFEKFRRDHKVERHHKSDPMPIAHHGGFEDQRAWPVQDFLGKDRPKGIQSTSADPTILKDKIVVIGTYLDKKDLHMTSIGILPGVRIVADAIETELGNGPQHLPKTFEMMIELGISCLLAWIFSHRAGTLAMLVVTGTFAFASKLLLDYSGWWINFVPFVLGVWIEQTHHRAQSCPPEAQTKEPEQSRKETEKAAESAAAPPPPTA